MKITNLNPYREKLIRIGDAAVRIKRKEGVCYISGGISNNPDFKEDFARGSLKVNLMGMTAKNPVWLVTVGSYPYMIRQCLRIIDGCDTVYMLRGWMQSQGARLEHDYAKAMGLKIIYEEEE